MEIELFNTVKQLFETVRKLRDRSANIPDKPFIYGFDIDIFVPELNLGIEFDGFYYHSFEYMRKCRGKRKWSDEDIRNYHQIKDDYFLAKGIKILHIKEEDWKTDKQLCIERSFKFLGVL